MAQYTEFKNHIQNSKTILITSHKGPDPDAIASSLVMYGVLKENFKSKNIFVSNESGNLSGLEFNVGADDIITETLKHVMDKVSPDLIILVDAGELSRATDEDEAVKSILKEKNIRYIVVDHHEIVKDGYDMIINSLASSAVEEVYDVLVTNLELDKYEGIEITTLMGIISDTGNFRYLTKDKKPERTFKIVNECLQAGFTIEQVSSQMNKYTFDHVKMYREVLNNFVVNDKYNYSFVTDKFFKKFVVGKISNEIYSFGAKMAMDQFIRNVDNKGFGFLISPDFENGGKTYNGSFRSLNDYIDTSIFARLLNGGGHKPASGFHIEAKNIDDAISQVEKVIDKNWKSAIIKKDSK